MDPEPLDFGNTRLSVCLGHGPGTERARVYSAFPHDAILVLSFTTPVLRQEITCHRPSQASLRAEYSQQILILCKVVAIYYSCKVRSQQVVTKFDIIQLYTSRVSAQSG